MSAVKKTETAVESVLTVKPNKEQSTTVRLVDKLLLSAKTMLQSVNEFEKELHLTLSKCLEHAEMHGDAMPADRLVKGLISMNHPSTTRFKDEAVAWFRQFSPVYWDAKGMVHLRKEGEEGYKDFNVTEAETTPFFETASAKRARTASDALHANALKPVTVQTVINRIKGVRKFVEDANSENKNGQVRGIAKGQEARIDTLVSAVDKAISDFMKKDAKNSGSEGVPQSEVA